jgi:extradiol dioxygenase family protein
MDTISRPAEETQPTFDRCSTAGHEIDCGARSLAAERGRGVAQARSRLNPLAHLTAKRYGRAMSIPRFHLAFPVRDLAEARAFYGEMLGCPEGRSSDEWIDFDFRGHQIVAHLAPGEIGHKSTNPVDGEDVPVRHFGVILTLSEWEVLAERLKAAGTRFVIEPQVRFKGQPGEQATMFFLDPSGNALEFKAFADDAMVFAK